MSMGAIQEKAEIVERFVLYDRWLADLRAGETQRVIEHLSRLHARLRGMIE